MSVKDAPTSCFSRNGIRHDSHTAATAMPSGSPPSAALDGPGASLPQLTSSAFYQGTKKGLPLCHANVATL